jgi:hypothetical protein
MMGRLNRRNRGERQGEGFVEEINQMGKTKNICRTDGG